MHVVPWNYSISAALRVRTATMGIATYSHQYAAVQLQSYTILMQWGALCASTLNVCFKVMTND